MGSSLAGQVLDQPVTFGAGEAPRQQHACLASKDARAWWCAARKPHAHLRAHSSSGHSMRVRCFKASRAQR